VYEGERNDLGQPHGKGKLVSMGGSIDETFIYEGEFKNGYMTGYGIKSYEAPNDPSNRGFFYVGNFRYGQPHGQCIMFYPFGSFYKGGVWENGTLINPLEVFDDLEPFISDEDCEGYTSELANRAYELTAGAKRDDITMDTIPPGKAIRLEADQYEENGVKKGKCYNIEALSRYLDMQKQTGTWPTSPLRNRLTVKDIYRIYAYNEVKLRRDEYLSPKEIEEKNKRNGVFPAPLEGSVKPEELPRSRVDIKESLNINIGGKKTRAKKRKSRKSRSKKRKSRKSKR
jgi:hypothetical protein